MHPESLAIIGASRRPDSFSHLLMKIALERGYKGAIYPINPKADSILGHTCYPAVLDVPGGVDVAMIALPRSAVAGAIDDCVKKGVSGIIILSSGFAEQGNPEGRKYQQELEELIEYANRNGTRVVGPNTMGYYCAPVSLDLLMIGLVEPGHTAFITQSGNLSHSLTVPGAARGLGFSHVVDIGNQADLKAHEFIRYFRDDPLTKTIAVHIEGLLEGRRFLEEVRKTVRTKPVVVIKSGCTEKGAEMVSSHTASIAGDSDIHSAAMKQCGAIQVNSFTELASTLLALNQGKLPEKNSMCIISQGGGDCVLTSDACIEKGLDVPELSESTKRKLGKIVPDNGSVSNPIDLAGWENVVEATEIALEDDQIDGVLVVGGFAGFSLVDPNALEVEKGYVMRMCELISRADKPVLIYTFFSFVNAELIGILNNHNIPLFMDHHDAVNAMAALAEYREYKTNVGGAAAISNFKRSAKIEDVLNDTEASVPEPEAKKILDAYHLPYPEEMTAKNKKEAVEFAGRIGYPVALKIVSRDILHKSDAGCVKLSLHNGEDVENAFEDITANARRHDENSRISGVLVSKMDTEEGVEVIIGGMRDPAFGPVVMFGLGGIFVEVLEDVSFRVCPIDEREAGEMIRDIRGVPVLKGIRGTAPVDIPSLKKALVNVSMLLAENPGIREVDLNPVNVHRKGLSVLDVRIITGEKERTSGSGGYVPDIQEVAVEAE